MAREGVVEKFWGRSVCPPPHRPQSLREDQVPAMIGKSLRRRRRRRRQWKGGGKEEKGEEESSGQEREVGSTNRKSSGAGGVGGEEKLGCQEEEKGSKWRRRIGVCGGPVEVEREEGGEATRTQYDFVMHQLIVHGRNDPTVSLPSFLA